MIFPHYTQENRVSQTNFTIFLNFSILWPPPLYPFFSYYSLIMYYIIYFNINFLKPPLFWMDSVFLQYVFKIVHHGKLNKHMFKGTVQDIVVSQGLNQFIANNSYIVSSSRNAQVTFVENAQLKIKSFKIKYLIRTWSDKAV